MFLKVVVSKLVVIHTHFKAYQIKEWTLVYKKSVYVLTLSGLNKFATCHKQNGILCIPHRHNMADLILICTTDLCVGSANNSKAVCLLFLCMLYDNKLTQFNNLQCACATCLLTAQNRWHWSSLMLFHWTHSAFEQPTILHTVKNCHVFATPVSTSFVVIKQLCLFRALVIAVRIVKYFAYNCSNTDNIRS